MFGAYKANDGFAVSFQNEWSVSVRFGPGSFSATEYTECPEEMRVCTSADAELAILYKGKVFGDVFPSVSSEAYAVICLYLAEIKPYLVSPETVHAEVEKLARSSAGWQKSPKRNPRRGTLSKRSKI